MANVKYFKTKGCYSITGTYQHRSLDDELSMCKAEGFIRLSENMYFNKFTLKKFEITKGMRELYRNEQYAKLVPLDVTFQDIVELIKNNMHLLEESQ